MTRRGELDALRGLMLALMTIAHVPTGIGHLIGQPFGYVSAAEGFVTLSGFIAGMVYSRRLQQSGARVVREQLQRRAGLIYGCHIALLLFLFTAVAALGIAFEQPAITNLLSFYLDRPLTALFGGALLLYRPPLLDILPMYVVFLLATPTILEVAAKRGWRVVLAASVLLWASAQFGAGTQVYEYLATRFGIPIPLSATGSFIVPAWQLLWVFGLWLGSHHHAEGSTASALRHELPGLVLGLAVAIALLGFAWRHVVGPTPLPDWPWANHLFDKWQLAPLRVLNFVALTIVLIRFGPWLAARLPGLRALEALGAAALPVFCTHLVLALLWLLLLGNETVRSPWFDLVLLATTFAVLIRVAQFSTGRRALARESATPRGLA